MTIIKTIKEKTGIVDAGLDLKILNVYVSLFDFNLAGYLFRLIFFRYLNVQHAI
jgi:hypothetical protein